MYAVVETGGKQYRAAPGEFVDVEKLPVEVGAQVTLDQVLLIVDGEAVTVGSPWWQARPSLLPSHCSARRAKVIFFHYVPKKRQRKKVGHRQYFTRLRIEAIQA